METIEKYSANILETVRTLLTPEDITEYDTSFDVNPMEKMSNVGFTILSRERVKEVILISSWGDSDMKAKMYI